MKKEPNLQNQDIEYSEMLMQLLEEFEEKLPKEFTYEDIIELGIDAWNLANKKEFLIGESLFEKELEDYKKYPIFEKMITYKVTNFSDSKNMIIDYSLLDDTLQVKTQHEEDYFNTIVKNMMNTSDEI